MVDRVEGMTRAAPTPCTRRAPISTWGFGALPTASDATMNRVIPMRKSRRRPWMSLRRPDSRMREAKTRE